MNEATKIEAVESVIGAWNRADSRAMTAQASPDYEFDLRRSDIPGESVCHQGPDALIAFSDRWRELLGPTQIVLEEAEELPDGRLFILIRQVGTGTQSGADVEAHHVHLHTFDEGGKVMRTEVFTDRSKGWAAAGLLP